MFDMKRDSYASNSHFCQSRLHTVASWADYLLVTIVINHDIARIV